MNQRVLICLLVMLTSVTLVSRAESADIDFARDIRPILQAHCYECHGPDLSENDLRLDQLLSVKRGGETGSDLLSSDPDQNEFYQRVTATDPGVRMPPEGEPLSDEQLATLRKWVEQGAEWPDDQTGPATKTDWLHSALSLYEDYLAPHVAALLVGAIMVGLMERAKVWRRKTQANGRATNGFADRLGGRVARLPRAWYLVVLFGWMAAYLWVDRGQLNNEIDRLSLLDQPLTAQIYAALHGDPPRPIRPDHDAGLDRTYYRGNDERNPKLFNNGYYRTATLHLRLTDRQGRRLSVGDAVPSDGGLIHIEIIRSPGTTAKLYDPEIWNRVAVVDASLTDGGPSSDRGPWAFEPTQAEGTWACQVPIRFQESENNGLNQGWLNIGFNNGHPTIPNTGLHLGVRYDIRVDEGLIAEESDLWMNNLYRGDKIQYPYPKGAVPMPQWFSTEPIPEVKEYENPDDAELLGEDEHLRE